MYLHFAPIANRCTHLLRRTVIPVHLLNSQIPVVSEPFYESEDGHKSIVGVRVIILSNRFGIVLQILGKLVYLTSTSFFYSSARLFGRVCLEPGLAAISEPPGVS